MLSPAVAAINATALLQANTIGAPAALVIDNYRYLEGPAVARTTIMPDPCSGGLTEFVQTGGSKSQHLTTLHYPRRVMGPYICTSCTATSGTLLAFGNSSRNLRELFDELDTLYNLPANWNGRGGVPPSRDSVGRGKQFAQMLPHWVPRAAIEPSGDGEINFVWRSKQAYLEVGIDEEGALSFYGRAADGVEVLGDFPHFPNSMPDSLRIALDKILDGGV